MNVLEEIKNDAAAMPLLVDWLGNGGKPVAHELAEKRAAVCTALRYSDKACPFNVEPRWWERFKMKVAEVIKDQLAIKNKMGVWVSVESELNMCKACGCCLPLKVHVPIEHIRDHTRPETFQKFPSWCWITKELQD